MRLGFKKEKKEARLNDIDIANFYRYIAKKYELNKGDVWLFEDAFILGNLLERFNNKVPIDRSKKGLIKRIEENNFIFIPAIYKDIHQTLFVYDKENKIFHHYNSYKGVDNLRYFHSFLRENFGDNKIIEHQSLEQDNGVDCGIYVIAITEFLVRRYQNNSMVMNWKINYKEAEEIKKNVPLFRKMLLEGKDYFTELVIETTQKKKKKLDQFWKNPTQYIITRQGDFIKITAHELVGIETNLIAIREKLKSTGRFGEKSLEQIAKERYDWVLELVNFDCNQLHDWIYNNLDKVEIIKKTELGNEDYQKAIGVVFRYIEESFSGNRGKWRVKHTGEREILVNEETGQVIYYSENIKDKFNRVKKYTIPSHGGRIKDENYDAVFIYLHCTYGMLGGSCVNEDKFPNVKFIASQSANLKYDMWHGSSPAPGGSQEQGWVNVTGDIHEISNELPNLDDIENKVHIDYPQLRLSAVYIEEIIEQEIAKGVKPERIFVGGFSSGALLTLTTALTSKHRLGGFIALSGILPRRDKLFSIANHANKNTPIFISNFPHDNWVPQWMGIKSAELLRNNGYNNITTKFKGGIGHSYNSSDIEEFLTETLDKESKEREEENNFNDLPKPKKPRIEKKPVESDNSLDNFPKENTEIPKDLKNPQLSTPKLEDNNKDLDNKNESQEHYPQEQKKPAEEEGDSDINYQNWTHEQLVKEIKKSKAEIEELKTCKNINSSEKQTNFNKKLEKLFDADREPNLNSSDNNFPTGWIAGRGILIIIGLVVVFFIVKNDKKGKKC